MAENKDSRGVPRGECLSPGCHCLQYCGQMTCTCGHPPGRHKNLSVPSQAQQTGVPGGSTSQAAAATGGYPAYTSASHPYTTYGSGYGASYPTSYQVYDPQQQYSQYAGQPPVSWKPHDLPLCKAQGCKETVFWDPNLGPFDYCSPTCRNNHLLPKERDKLEKDLKEFTEELCNHAPALPKEESHDKKQSHDNRHMRQPQGGKSSSPVTESSKEKKRQKTAVVKFTDVKRMGFGVIFSELGYTSEHVHGFVITGVEKDSAAYSKLQSDELRLLDIVFKINGNPVDSTNMAQCRAAATNSFSLTIDRSISLAPTSKLLSIIKTRGSYFTHILALRSPSVYEQGNFGITFSKDDVNVIGAEKGSSSRISGMEFEDTILMYAKADQKDIEYPSFTGLQFAFEKILPKEKSLVIAIKRRHS